MDGANLKSLEAVLPNLISLESFGLRSSLASEAGISLLLLGSSSYEDINSLQTKFRTFDMNRFSEEFQSRESLDKFLLSSNCYLLSERRKSDTIEVKGECGDYLGFMILYDSDSQKVAGNLSLSGSTIDDLPLFSYSSDQGSGEGITIGMPDPLIQTLGGISQVIFKGNRQLRINTKPIEITKKPRKLVLKFSNRNFPSSESIFNTIKEERPELLKNETEITTDFHVSYRIISEKLEFELIGK